MCVVDQEAKVTVCASDLSCRKLFTADDKGYVTVWRMDEFMENMENTDRVEQVELCDKIYSGFIKAER